MILSYEHAELKREYLIKEIDKLPVGHEIMLRQKYPGVYITNWPGHPELKQKRMTANKPEAKRFLELCERRKALTEELAAVDGYIKYHSSARKVKDPIWMDRKFFDACIKYGDGNPRPKPDYAPEFDGVKFRSKSEANIAQLISGLGYEYVYETEFELIEGVIEYPDFTVWVPEIGRSFFLEHFGRLDKPDYKADAGWKINHYVDFGIIPGRDIVFSYESDKIPLDLDIVKQQINALIMANTLKK